LDSQAFSESFGIEKPEFIAFVYERYKHYLEQHLNSKDKLEWEMLEQNITYKRDDV